MLTVRRRSRTALASCCILVVLVGACSSSDVQSHAWDEFGSEYDVANVITDMGDFEVVFNETFAEHEGCEQAYAAAKEAEQGYGGALDSWVDDASSKPGLGYDRWVARFLASTRWLRQESCEGAQEFIQVG